MKASNILQQLYREIPSLTNYFSDGVDIVNISANNSTTVLVETSTPHELVDQSYVNISGVKYPTEVLSITRFKKILTIVTETPHDFTYGRQKTVEVIGANEANLNGVFDISAIPNRNTIVAQITDAGDFTGTGDMKVLEETGFAQSKINGLKQITLIDETNFSYTVPSALTFSYSGGFVTTSYRMASAIDEETALAMYTAQETEDYWLFVIVGPVVASKDRHNNSDAIYSQNTNAAYKQETVHRLDILVIANASDFLSSMTIRDNMEDIAKALVASLCAYKVDNGFSAGNYYSLVFDSHQTASYNKAVYSHNFSFQSVGQINDMDVFVPKDDVAFRDVDLAMIFYPKNI